MQHKRFNSSYSGYSGIHHHHHHHPHHPHHLFSPHYRNNVHAQYYANETCKICASVSGLLVSFIVVVRVFYRAVRIYCQQQFICLLSRSLRHTIAAVMVISCISIVLVVCSTC